MKSVSTFILTCVAGTLSMFGFLAGLGSFLSFLVTEPENLPQQIYNAIWFLSGLAGFSLTAVAGLWAHTIWNARPEVIYVDRTKKADGPAVSIVA